MNIEPLKYLLHDFFESILTMLLLSLVCAVPLWFVWNNVLCERTGWERLDFVSAILINFCWNWLIFFKLQRQNILVAYPNEPEEFEDEEEVE